MYSCIFMQKHAIKKILLVLVSLPWSVLIHDHFYYKKIHLNPIFFCFIEILCFIFNISMFVIILRWLLGY